MSSRRDEAWRVLYLLDYAELGGGETSFLSFLDGLARLAPGIEPAVALPAEGPVAQAVRARGVRVEVIAWPSRLRRGPLPWFSPSAARALGRLIDNFGPTLVHANNFFGFFYAAPPARRRGLPVVWTCHGWYDIDRPIKRFWARRYASHVTCVSDAVRAEAQRYLPDGRAETDYLGIAPFIPEQDVISESFLVSRNRNRNRISESSFNLDPSSPCPLRAEIRREFAVSHGIDESTPLIGVVGRFQPIKGHQHLLAALPALLAEAPGLRVWLIGDARPGDPIEAAHKAVIEATVRERGWDGIVQFLGFRNDARRLLRALDVLAIPSEAESFSMAAVEGLEAGIPVVGPDGWGPREIIDAPACGLRFTPGDAADLARRLADALLRRGEGAQFDPAAGPRRVAEHFSVDAHVRRTLAVYQRLTGIAFTGSTGFTES